MENVLSNFGNNMEQSRMRKCLLPWIVKNKERDFMWCNLSQNPNAITFLETNQDTLNSDCCFPLRSKLGNYRCQYEQVYLWRL